MRLNSDGSQQASFVIGVAGNEIAVRAIAIATDPFKPDKVYVGGDFAEGILRLNEDGSADGDFAVGISSEGGICSNETILTSN